MHFEYDESKDLINTKKHEINFIEAQKLWLDENMLEVELNFEDEMRWLCIGKIDGKFFSAIVTYREKKIRIISVRRSRKREVESYENS